MKKVSLLSAAAVVVMLFASCEKYDQSDEIGDLKKQIAQTDAKSSANAAAIAANKAAIEAMMVRVSAAIDALGDSDAALFDALAKGAERLEGGLEALTALQAQFDEAYASALVLVNEALAGSIAQDAELAQRIEELRLLVEALQPGADGLDGTDGAQGSDGPAGDQGPVGPVGPVGPQGEDGADGADGEDGSGIVEEDLDLSDGGRSTLGLNGYTQGEYDLLVSSGFTIRGGQTSFSYQPDVNVDHHYELPPPVVVGGVLWYEFENDESDDVRVATLQEAINMIKNY